MNDKEIEALVRHSRLATCFADEVATLIEGFPSLVTATRDSILPEQAIVDSLRLASPYLYSLVTREREARSALTAATQSDGERQEALFGEWMSNTLKKGAVGLNTLKLEGVVRNTGINGIQWACSQMTFRLYYLAQNTVGEKEIYCIDCICTNAKIVSEWQKIMADGSRDKNSANQRGYIHVRVEGKLAWSDDDEAWVCSVNSAVYTITNGLYPSNYKDIAPGTKVLCRNDTSGSYFLDTFLRHNSEFGYICEHCVWQYIIPYKGNEASYDGDIC